MLTRSERTLENIPVGSLGIISLRGCEELGQKVEILSLSEPVFRVLDPVKPRASSKNLYVVRICT